MVSIDKFNKILYNITEPAPASTGVASHRQRFRGRGTSSNTIHREGAE